MPPKVEKKTTSMPLANLSRLEEGLLDPEDQEENATRKTWLSSWGSSLLETCQQFTLNRSDFTSVAFGISSVAIAAIPKFYGSATIPWTVWASLAGLNSSLGMNLRYTAKLSIKDEALTQECKKLIKDMVIFRAQHLASKKIDSAPHEELFNQLAQIVIASKSVHQRNVSKMIKDALLLVPFFLSFSLTVFFSRQVEESAGDEDEIYKRNMALLVSNITFTCLSILQIYFARHRKKETKNYRKAVAENASFVHWEVEVSNQNTSIPKAGEIVLNPDAYKVLGLDANDIDDMKIILRDNYSESIEVFIAQAIVDVQRKLEQTTISDKNIISEAYKPMLRRPSSGRDMLKL